MSSMSPDQKLRSFLSPEGSTDLTHSLAVRRSLLRWSVLQRLCTGSTNPIIQWVLTQLDTLSVEQRYQVLGDPQFGFWLYKLAAGEECPAAELAIVGQISEFVAFRASFSLNLSGAMAFHWQPVGTYLLKGDGDPLNNLVVSSASGRLRFSGTRQDGSRVQYVIDATDTQPQRQGVCRRKSVGKEAWEVVDGWSNFQDTFDDGNMSLTFTVLKKKALHSHLERAWRLIGNVLPNALIEMKDTARYLSPIRPLNPTNGIPSFSTPSLPGVIFIGIHGPNGRLLEAAYLAESCLHEHLHNRLYLLDQAAPLVCPSDPPRRYYSPWKKSARPAEGLLHAIYVFSHIAWFWNRVAQNAKNPTLKQAIEKRDSQRQPLRDGLNVISGSTELTPVGLAVFNTCLTIAEGLHL